MRLHKAFIALGSNIGNRLENLREAVDRLSLNEHTTVLEISAVYMTEPVGETGQERFFNGVVLIETLLPPEELRSYCKTIERELGRPEAYRRWSPRVIDLDIILYDDWCVRSETLSIPHHEMHNRKFVLVPLLDIANPLHPSIGQTAVQLLDSCSDRSVLIKLKKKLTIKKNRPDLTVQPDRSYT
ncbi:MAG: 2-amino-4-hydroxy-6-hydroxymethyldihydropteridine diphosphokinase [Chlorobiaceae bacterium]|nr:2-amino-4-hydroxy-6-hydroxymethyldihydropteridine diphosphokinase [Chlorobiaceae bacterium]